MGKCIITYKGKKYSEEQFKEHFINNKQEFATSIAKNRDVIDSFKRKMEGIDYVFSQSPELASIGSKAQYLQYLSTIFPNSKVKDIVYHGTNNQDKQEFKKERAGYLDKGFLGKGFYSTYHKNYTKAFGSKTYGLLLNIKNPLLQTNEKIEKFLEKAHKAQELGYDSVFQNFSYDENLTIKDAEEIGAVEYNLPINQSFEQVVFEPEQIHVIGSKNDIEGFKEFVNKPTIIDKNELQKQNLIPLTSNFTRESVKNDSDYIYLFTDNAKRTSGKNSIEASSWYRQKYTTSYPLNFPSMTQAVARGLNNAFPITTMVDDNRTQWKDSQFDEYKKIIDDEINTIKEVQAKFKGIKFAAQNPFGQGKISNMKQSAPKIWNYLNEKLAEIGIDNSGETPKVKNISQVVDKNQLQKQNIFTVKPIQSADKKAIIKASVANKFIGFAEGIAGSSTAEYARQINEQANNIYNFDNPTNVFLLEMPAESKLDRLEEGRFLIKDKTVLVKNKNIKTALVHELTHEFINSLSENKRLELYKISNDLYNIVIDDVFFEKYKGLKQSLEFISEKYRRNENTPQFAEEFIQVALNNRIEVSKISELIQDKYKKDYQKILEYVDVERINKKAENVIKNNKIHTELKSYHEKYIRPETEIVNSGNYNSNDVVFVSIGGKRGNEIIRKEQQDKTIKEALKAIEAGATLITDNKSYVESSDYNEGEKRLAKNLEAKGYNYSEQIIDGQVLGVWNKDISQVVDSGIDTSKKINIYAGTNENTELSNFAIRPFKFIVQPIVSKIYGEKSFDSVEQAFQWHKGLFSEAPAQFGGSDGGSKTVRLMKQIKETINGAEIKKLGQEFNLVKAKQWDSFSSVLMKDLLKESFEQNPKALEQLLNTGNAELTHTQDKGKWGKEFPKLLMEVRQELKPKVVNNNDSNEEDWTEKNNDCGI